MSTQGYSIRQTNTQTIIKTMNTIIKIITVAYGDMHGKVISMYRRINIIRRSLIKWINIWHRLFKREYYNSAK